MFAEPSKIFEEKAYDNNLTTFYTSDLEEELFNQFSFKSNSHGNGDNPLSLYDWKSPKYKLIKCKFFFL